MTTDPGTKRPIEIALQDPLSKVTRTERRNLLSASLIGVVIAKTGLVPSKITALGIEFDRADQTALLKMLAIVVAYFLAAFFLYAVSDLVAWRTALYRANVDLQREHALRTEADQKIAREIAAHLRYSSRRWSIMAGPVSLGRAVFEFALPVVFGIYAMAALLTTKPTKAVLPAKSAVNFPSQAMRWSMSSVAVLPIVESAARNLGPTWVQNPRKIGPVADMGSHKGN